MLEELRAMEGLREAVASDPVRTVQRAVPARTASECRWL